MTSAQRPIGLRMAAVAALVGLLLAATWLSAGRVGAASPNHVDIVNLTYNPAQMSVQVGDAVTWTNNDGVGHTVTSDAGAPAAFDSGTIAGGGTFAFTFTVAGTYDYHCKIHASMHGSVVVEEAPAASATPAASSLPDGAVRNDQGPSIGPAILSLLLLAGLAGLSVAVARRPVRS
jgi:plastocyanin